MNRNDTLRKLSKMLYGRNYAVSLRLFPLSHIPNGDVAQYVAIALGSGAIVGGVQTVAANEMLENIEVSIRHQGDESYGPKQAVLTSEAFEEHLGSLISHLVEATAKATDLQAFWLKEGHPDYPVFWDFAYLIDSPSGSEIFIGSSSD